MKISANYFVILLLVLSVSCSKKMLYEHVTINIYPDKNGTTASAMPEFKAESALAPYRRRFEYLLINIPSLHLPENVQEQNELFNLFPDTLAIQRLYLKKLTHDKSLTNYFQETFAAIVNAQKHQNTYSVDELMEVASKFFYCDQVMPDTSIQARICIGLNGLKEVNWEKDYTLLQAFCYEAIFNELDNDESQIWNSFVSKKKLTCEQFKKNIKSLNAYLEAVKINLFEAMKNDEILKQKLLNYYELNKSNLAFVLIN